MGAEDGDRVSPGPWLEPSTRRTEGSCERLIHAGHDPTTEAMDVEKAIVVKTDEYDEIMALQSAEPGTARDLTAEEQAVADSILDAEDGCVVLRATADNDGQGQPVWYLGDEEAPATWDASGHTCWPAGATWPREAPADPQEPQALGIAQSRIDYACRSNDVDDDEEAADLAVSELLDDPAGWCRFVPDHWQPAAWVDCYRTAYAAAWGR